MEEKEIKETEKDDDGRGDGKEVRKVGEGMRG